MGAAASVRMLYKDACGWFKQYIDTETYMDDFKAMDKHNENALSYPDVRDWMTNKSKKDPCWSLFLTSGPVLAIAHKNACRHGDSSSSVSASKMVDVTEFRTLLVHLFAISILWSHFQNADNWEESGGDIGSKQLNFDAFKLACRTLASANAKEELSDDQIKSDFEMLDENQSLTIGFIEVCNFCCKFIDDPEVEKKIHIPKFFGESHPDMISDDLMSGLEAGPKTYFENSSIEEKNHGMIAALQKKLESQQSALKTATALEHQYNIRRKYSTIDDLIEHPICCGYLMKFCESQHNSESLKFICDVDEFREIFSGDEHLWSTEWRDVDGKVMIDDDGIDESLMMKLDWKSSANKDEAIRKIEIIVLKYFMKESLTQVCISENVIKKTAKRIKLLHLYGPAVFEEACLDPIMTLEKDVLPRFRVSDIIDQMVVCVASCEPPPPAAELKVPPPGNLLLQVSSIDSFSEIRRFSLDEVVGSDVLYTGFYDYLKLKGGKGAERLLCVRKIDIYEQLMKISCHKEAVAQSLHLFRYFIGQRSAFEIPINSIDRKRLMLKLAVPTKDMFEQVRFVALELLKIDFHAFQETAVYIGYSEAMREMKVDTDFDLNGSGSMNGSGSTNPSPPKQQTSPKNKFT